MPNLDKSCERRLSDLKTGNPTRGLGFRKNWKEEEMKQWHSIWDKARFWDSRFWKRVRCLGEKCKYCDDGWKLEY
jgi:hypothetical protein